MQLLLVNNSVLQMQVNYSLQNMFVSLNLILYEGWTGEIKLSRNYMFNRSNIRKDQASGTGSGLLSAGAGFSSTTGVTASSVDFASSVVVEALPSPATSNSIHTPLIVVIRTTTQY